MKTKESGEKMSSLEVKTKATEILRRTIPNYPLLTRWWYKNFRQRNPNLSIYLGKKPNFCVERIIKRVKSIQELIAWIEERYNQCDPPTVEEVCELAGTIYHPTNNQSMTFKWFRNFINTNPSLYHIFSPINENKLVVWIQEQLNCGKEVTRVEFQEMVYQELREKGIPSQSFNMTLWINHFETENQHLLTQYSSSSNSNTSDIYLGVKNWVEENFKDTPISFATLKEVFTKIKRKIHPASAPVSKRQISLLLKKFPELKSKIASYFEEDSDPQRGLKKPITISRKRTFSELNEMENNENIENPRRKKPKKEDKT